MKSIDEETDINVVRERFKKCNAAWKEVNERLEASAKIVRDQAKELRIHKENLEKIHSTLKGIQK